MQTRSAPRTAAASLRHLRIGWAAALGAAALAAGVRLWNALAGPVGWGYDAWGHVAYVLYLDLYRALPHADQGWSYFHPPLHYLLAQPLAWTRNGDALLRGLMLLASAASLGTAWLAARVQRRVAPERTDLAWLAFGAVALLPAQLAASAMPGNELTAALCVSLAVAHFAAHPEGPGSRDFVTGALLGVALLAKYSAGVAVIALAASWITLALLAPAPRGASLLRALRRVAVAAVAVALVAGPFYARNLREQGRLLPTSTADPFVYAAESGQPPGVRRVADYLRFPPRLFGDASPLAPHLLDSVWGSLYANAWLDSHRETDRDRVLWLERGTPPAARALLALGLVPTGLAVAGAVLALGDVARGRRRALYVPLLWLAAGMLAAQGLFAWRMPTWAALKASYLLPASLSFGVFLARGFEALAARGRRAAVAVLAVLGACALFASVLALEGVGVPRRVDAPTAGAAHFTFGEYDAARDVYAALLERSFWPVPWLDNLAATRLASGDAAAARALYERAVVVDTSVGRESAQGDLLAYRRGQLAVATALAGDADAALAGLEDLLERHPLPELRANRGVLLAGKGRVAEAEAELRDALAADAEMWPVWENLARLLRRDGRDADAREAWARAERAACAAPRGIPRAIGSGENIEWGVGRRWLLQLSPDGGAPRIVLPSDFRGACARLEEEGA